MTRQESIREVCRIVALAYRSIGDYGNDSDGFCDLCFNRGKWLTHYCNDGEAINYVRQAVVDKLIRDGYSIHQGFDPVTGKELENDESTHQAEEG